jgi:hypothetical protein
MANEDTVLEEAMDNLKEAGQRIRATQSLMRSQGMPNGENHRDLLTRLSAALATVQSRAFSEHRKHLLIDPGSSVLKRPVNGDFSATLLGCV